MNDYRAPWSKTVKITTYATNIFLIGIGLTMVLMGLSQVRSGQPIGWFLVANSLWCWLIPLLLPLWAPRGYRIGESAVIVRKKVGDEEIPFEKIESIEIRDSREIFASTMRIIGSGGYYGAFGTFSGGILSSFRALATNDGPNVVIRMKRGEPVVISPENPYDFASELSRRVGVEVLDKEIEAQAISTQKLPLTPIEKALELVALILLIFTFAAVAYFWNKLPETIPAHFNEIGKPDGWGPKGTILISPGMALGVYILLTTITVFASKTASLPSTQSKAARMVHSTRGMLSVIKCFIMAISAYITYQIGATALGKSQGLGIGFTVVMLLFGVFVGPVTLIFMAISASKSEDS